MPKIDAIHSLDNHCTLCMNSLKDHQSKIDFFLAKDSLKLYNWLFMPKIDAIHS